MTMNYSGLPQTYARKRASHLCKGLAIEKEQNKNCLNR